MIFTRARYRIADNTVRMHLRYSIHSSFCRMTSTPNVISRRISRSTHTGTGTLFSNKILHPTGALRNVSPMDILGFTWLRLGMELVTCPSHPRAPDQKCTDFPARYKVDTALGMTRKVHSFRFKRNRTIQIRIRIRIRIGADVRTRLHKGVGFSK